MTHSNRVLHGDKNEEEEEEEEEEEVFLYLKCFCGSTFCFVFEILFDRCMMFTLVSISLLCNHPHRWRD